MSEPDDIYIDDETIQLANKILRLIYTDGNRNTNTIFNALSGVAINILTGYSETNSKEMVTKCLEIFIESLRENWDIKLKEIK